MARRLGERLALPVSHMDFLFWKPGWRQAEPEEFRARIENSVAGDGWISEGNYSSRSFDLRLPRADLIIWLETPRAVCLRRVILRTLLRRPRPDLPAGCEERLDAEFLTFLRYVWTFDRDSRPNLEAARAAIAPEVPVVRLRGERQIDDFLTEIRSSKTSSVSART